MTRTPSSPTSPGSTFGDHPKGLAKAYEEAWVERFNDTPPQKYLVTAVFDAYELIVHRKVYGAVVEALRVAARSGNSFVTKAYVDVIARANNAPLDRSGGGQPTQGQSLASAYERALAEQEAIDRNRKGTAA